MAITISEFVKTHTIFVQAEPVKENPRLLQHISSDIEFADNCTHWRVVLRRKKTSRASLTVFFSRADRRNTSTPTAEEVLDSLAIDASEKDSAPREIATELSLDMNSATKYIETCQKRANGLKRVLGEGAYSQLVLETHRLIDA